VGSTFTSAAALTWSGGSMGGAGNIIAATTANITGDVTKPGSGVFRVVGGFTLAAGKKLDLTVGKMIVNGGDVGSFSGSAYTGLTGRIAAGRNGAALPLWDGVGIITSQSTASGGNLTSIAIAKASDARPATATATALWAGLTVTATDVLVMYTYGGDANLDGKLNIDDYVRIDSGIASHLAGWSNGDFNYDGKVNIDDYTTVIDANIGNQSGVFFTTGGSTSAGLFAVPEPVLTTVPIALLWPLRTRRRKIS
jgi:hypothetical protein